MLALLLTLLAPDYFEELGLYDYMLVKIIGYYSIISALCLWGWMAFDYYLKRKEHGSVVWTLLFIFGAYFMAMYYFLEIYRNSIKESGE